MEKSTISTVTNTFQPIVAREILLAGRDHNGAVTYKRIKVTDAERTEKRQNLHPVMEVVSVPVIVDGGVVRSAYVPNK